MDQPMLLGRDESTRHLNAYFQRKIRRDESVAADIGLDRFPFDQLHDIEISTGVGFTKMKDSSNVRVAQLCGRARLAPKSFARIRVSRIAGTDHLERNQGAKRKVSGPVGDPHRATA